MSLQRLEGARERTLHAVVFDFDGVIVDTEPLHWRAFDEVLRPLGLGFSWREYVRLFLGFDDRDVIREAAKRAGKKLSEEEFRRLLRAKADAFERLVEKTSLRPYRGVLPLLRQLQGRVPIALCSGALRRDIEPVLRRMGLFDTFRVWVTADDVARSKPDPASYRLIARRLRKQFGRHIDAMRCVVIEDSPAGIAAAKQVGFFVIAVTNTYPREQLKDADRVVASLGEVTLRKLQRWVGASSS